MQKNTKFLENPIWGIIALACGALNVILDVISVISDTFFDFILFYYIPVVITYIIGGILIIANICGIVGLWKGRNKIFAAAGIFLLGAGRIIIFYLSILLPLIAAFFISDEDLRVQCLSNMKQLGLGYTMYALDHDDASPESMAEMLSYCSSSCFLCPTSGNTDTDTSDYLYYGFLQKSGSPSDFPIFVEKRGHHGDMINVCYSDGHVESIIIAEHMNDKDFTELICHGNKDVFNIIYPAFYYGVDSLK